MFTYLAFKKTAPHGMTGIAVSLGKASIFQWGSPAFPVVTWILPFFPMKIHMTSGVGSPV